MTYDLKKKHQESEQVNEKENRNIQQIERI